MTRRVYFPLSIITALLSAALLSAALTHAGEAGAPPGLPDAPGLVLYTVDMTGDTLVNTGCQSAAIACTLRGALALANNLGAASVIQFDASLNGTVIALSNTLYMTGGQTSIAGNGSVLTLIDAATSLPAFSIGSSSNKILNVSIFGDGASGGSFQDGVVILSGGGNLIQNSSLYNLGGNGVTIQVASGNVLNNNRIGTFREGGVISTSCAQPNHRWGVLLSSPNNTLSDNTIGCNLFDGILIGPVSNNELYGNYIGVTYPYTRIANNGNGVQLVSANGNKIGKAGSAPNVIARNGQNNIQLAGPNTHGNLIQNNYIGTAPLGGSSVTLVNYLNGIAIEGGAHDNIIGGDLVAQFNTIDGHPDSGIYINNSPGNQVLGNGVTFNYGNGVLLEGITTTGTLISGTFIHDGGYFFNNGGGGIRERNGAGHNVWSHLQVFHNRRIGIDKDPTVNAPDAPYPVVRSAIRNGALITVSGGASPSGFLAPTVVELYSMIPNPNGFFDGYFFLGSTVADNGGNWTLAVPSAYGDCFMAFQTHSNFLVSTSSEFGPTNCRVVLPLIMK